MRTTRVMFATLFVTFALTAIVPVRAQTTVTECKGRIDVIQTDLDAIFLAGGIGGNNSTRTYNSLTSKLDGANTKLDEGKFPDAIQKLQDFKLAVEVLRDAAKPKLSVDDAALLLDGNGDFETDEGVNGAIACVALLP